MSTTSPTSDYVVPTPRVASLPKAAPETYKAAAALSASITLDKTLRELINIRVSQINGCTFCLDMHTNDARKAGETNQRLDTLAGWPESPFFTARERAALHLAEVLTRLADAGHVSDEVYDEAARHFDEGELMQVLWAITMINTWNRVAVPTKSAPLSA
jgi:AhpD family alkylhydroperoxidase